MEKEGRVWWRKRGTHEEREFGPLVEKVAVSVDGVRFREIVLDQRHHPLELML